jgi:hypothetical protein
MYPYVYVCLCFVYMYCVHMCFYFLTCSVSQCVITKPKTLFFYRYM